MAIFFGRSVRFMYRYQAVAMPASASQNGGCAMPCSV